MFNVVVDYEKLFVDIEVIRCGYLMLLVWCFDDICLVGDYDCMIGECDWFEYLFVVVWLDLMKVKGVIDLVEYFCWVGEVIVVMSSVDDDILWIVCCCV